MLEIKKCCGCMSLRQGTYMSAIYAIVFSLLGVIASSVLLHHANALVDQALSEAGHDSFGDRRTYETTKNVASTFVKVIYWIALIIYLVWFITAILVFPAIKMEKRGLLMPFLIFTGVLTGICLFGLISSFTRMGQTFATPSGIIQFATQIILICLNIYVMICLQSFYKNNMREAHEVNTLPVSAVITGPTTAVNVPPPYSYNYHPAPAGEPMNKGPYPGYDYQQPPPVYGHNAMTQKI